VNTKEKGEICKELTGWENSKTKGQITMNIRKKKEKTRPQ